MDSRIFRIYKAVSLLIVITAIIHFLSLASWGKYVGPSDVLSTTFGNSPDQMHIESDDMGADHYAGIAFVKRDGTIVIVDGPYDFSDIFNVKIFKSGKLIKYFLGPRGPWLPERIQVNEHGIYMVGAHHSDGANHMPYKYDLDIYNYEGTLVRSIKYGSYKGHFLSVLPQGDFITEDNDKSYYRYSPSGQLLNKLSKAPLELGEVKKEVQVNVKSSKKFKTVITYDDKEYEIIDDVDRDAKFQRDDNKNIYAIEDYYEKYVKRYNSCGLLQGIVTLPEDVTFREEGYVEGREPEVFHHTQYDSPTIDAYGNVYAVRVTPGTYSVIKWTWEPDSGTSIQCGDKKVVLDILSYFQSKTYEGDKRIYNDDDIALWSGQATGNNIGSWRKLFAKILRNEIFARHGRLFESPELRQIFDNVTWYKPRRKFNESELNTIEKQNVENIVQYEKKMGWK